MHYNYSLLLIITVSQIVFCYLVVLRSPIGRIHLKKILLPRGSLDKDTTTDAACQLASVAACKLIISS
jgi:hypothetical protein